MKTMINIGRIGAWCAGTALMVGITFWPAASSNAAEQMKGAQRLLKISTAADAEALKSGDTVAMVCSKCKSVMLHNVSTAKGHVKTMTVGEKHLCPGCNSTIEVVGAGKGKHDEVKHVCAQCGDASVFCCATQPGTGATKGMQEK